LSKILGVNLPQKHKMVFAGDFHFGNIACNEHRVLDMINMIKSNEDWFLILMGDNIDAITKLDKRHDSTVAYDPIKQANKFVEMFEPIKGRIIVVLQGNHCRTLESRGFGNLAEDVISRGLDATYGTYSCVITVSSPSGKFMYRVHCHHGKSTFNSNAMSAVRREAVMLDALKAKLCHQCGDANVQVCGHAHKLLILPPTEALYIETKSGKMKSSYQLPEYSGGLIHPDHRWYACSGSFLKQFVEGETTYGEVAGYAPVDLGFIVLTCDGKVTGMNKVIV